MEEELITTEEAIKKVDGAFDSLEELRSTHLGKTQSLQVVNNTALEKEQTRLTKKYGTAHPRVQAVNKRIAYNREQKKALDFEVEQSKVKVVTNQPDTWQVHGLVIDKNNKGVKDMTISLYLENGKWARELGHTCTNDQGYFSINPSAELSKKYVEKKLLLTVTDKEGKFVCQEKEPVQVAPGRQDYRIIVLSAEKCPPPPEKKEEDDTPIPEPPPPTPEPEPAKPFKLSGQITNKAGKALPKLIVQPRSKNGNVEEFIKATRTNNKGMFSFNLDPKKLPKLFDGKTDIFIEVMNVNKKVIHRTDQFRIEAGVTKEISIVI